MNTSQSERSVHAVGEKISSEKNLWHARGAFGALVSKDKHHPRFDFARGERRIEPVEAVEALGDALERDALSTSDLRDRAAGGEVAPQDGDVARALDRVCERAHDVLRLPKRQHRRVRDVLRQRTASDRQLRAVDQVRVREEVLEQRGDAPNAVQVLHHVTPRRLQIRQVRRAVCHGLKVVDREFDVGCAGHGQEMKDL